MAFRTFLGRTLSLHVVMLTLLHLIICGDLYVSRVAHSQDVEIGDLILNKTITRLGNDFYNAFAQNWIPPGSNGAYTVKISEAPSARWGSIVGVYVNNELQFKTILSIRARNVEEIAQQAVQVIWVRLMKISIQKQQEDGVGDLYGDGL